MAKNYINIEQSNTPKTGVLFCDYILNVVQRKQKRLNANYGKNYLTVLTHLKKFSEINEVILYTNSITEEFLEDFIEYLLDLNLKQNYLQGLVGSIKTMVKHAGNHGYAIDTSYDNIEFKSESSFNIYLTTNDIVRLYYFKGLTKKEERIKDLFIIGCLTAMRYSDYSTLFKENFKDGFIIKKTKKTGIIVTIPMHEYVREIYSKYNGELVFGLCIQHFNRYIKKICKKVGFDLPISFSYTKGGSIITETKFKWELISSHTARRSAATNMLISGMKPYEIMAVTGHTTEKSFFRYIGITTTNVAKQIAGYNYFNN